MESIATCDHVDEPCKQNAERKKLVQTLKENFSNRQNYILLFRAIYLGDNTKETSKGVNPIKSR